MAATPSTAVALAAESLESARVAGPRVGTLRSGASRAADVTAPSDAAPGAAADAATSLRIDALTPPSSPASLPAPWRGDTRRSRTLMIVGGAAFLGGAIVGGDAGKIVMLGGLGVGLYGLYLHLQ